jgi:hypothetical protein
VFLFQSVIPLPGSTFTTSLIPTLLPQVGKDQNSQEQYLRMKIKTATFLQKSTDIWQNISARKVRGCRRLPRTQPDPFYSLRNITGQSTFWFGHVPTFWSQGKKSHKNLDTDLMDSSICQDTELLSGFFF